MDVTIIGLDHVQLAIPRQAEPQMRKFYGELLGLAEIEKPPALKSRGGVWFQLPDGRQLHLGVEDDFRPSRKAHPCFIAPGLDALAARLTEGGHAVQFDRLAPPVARFYAQDPAGNRLEFADRPSAPEEKG